MNVLMLTPRVDPEEDVLGFIYTWVKELGSRVDKLIVITPKAGSNKALAELPKNIVVHSLEGKKGLNRLFYASRILLNAIKTEKIDVIFTHMYVEFALFAAPFAKIFRKPVVMWYTHGHISVSLKIAYFFVDRVVTASKESCRIEGEKVSVIGHGIDIERFKPMNGILDEKIILYVGRISPVKDLETLIKAVKLLEDKEFKVMIIGKPYGKEGEEYFQSLKRKVVELRLKDKVVFEGNVAFKDILQYYQQSTVFVNPSSTGSLDKTVLEAMACEIPSITCNEAFLNVFDGEMKKKCYFEKGDYRDLAEKIELFINNDETELRKRHRKIVVDNHSVDRLVDKLVMVFGM
jgi:glycosyltransferase involved in cell wall biosynthesis